MYILGINAYHGDSSACIIKDGQLIAAVEEERFTRIKHWAGFPKRAIQYCLDEADISINKIQHIAVNRNPNANIINKMKFVAFQRPSVNIIKDRMKNSLKIGNIRDIFLKEFNKLLKAKIHYVEHHIAHLASSFMVSPFNSAAVVSVDGFGDFVGCMWGTGEKNKLKIKDKIYFPHSLGLLYLAITQYLGFPKYGDEYKVMGLAAYGKPTEIDKLRKIVKLLPNGRFELDLNYFIHHSEGVTMTWDGAPEMGSVFSKNLENLLGVCRKQDETLSSNHENIAASLQYVYEEAFFHILNHVYKKTNNSILCLAGGCAMNSVANGKIFDNTPFKEVYIQSAAGDAGGALGAAYYVWNHKLKNKRNFVMEKSYWGPEYSNDEIAKKLDLYKEQLNQLNCNIIKIDNNSELCKKTASEIVQGKVIGWFQGRMEWGARALGNRSILADPSNHNMKDILNARIKKREPFRPFAPSILLEYVSEYFEKDYPDPFMIKVYPIKEDKRNKIVAVTHVDGTGRLQTVNKNDNPLYWQLIMELNEITGIPVILNTSFNENEPIVCKPSEALDCFIRTKMDVLVIGNYFISKLS